eukprot:416078-Amphidinium_carterae.1
MAMPKGPNITGRRLQFEQDATLCTVFNIASSIALRQWQLHWWKVQSLCKHATMESLGKSTAFIVAASLPAVDVFTSEAGGMGSLLLGPQAINGC